MLTLRIGIIASLLLATPVIGQAPVGRYRAHEQDVASEIELKKDGSFTYFLSAGSLDEHAAGKWRWDGPVIRLETLPKPVPASFTAGKVAQTKDDKLAILVTNPQGQRIAAVDLKVGFDDGEPVESYTQDYGWSLSTDEVRTPKWVQFSVPIHDLESPRFPIDLTQGNQLTFILTPNDLGTLDMANIVLEARRGELVMRRNGGELLFGAVTSRDR